MQRLRQEAVHFMQSASVGAGGPQTLNGAPGAGALPFTHNQSWAGLQEVVAVVANAVGPALAAAAAGPQVRNAQFAHVLHCNLRDIQQEQPLR